MESLFDKWSLKVPKYHKAFRGPLFEGISQKGGGSEKSRVDLGKHFGSNYELYIYAFFLGLYSNEFVPLGDKDPKDDFGHPIQFWGSKAGKLDRRDFSTIQEYLFISLVAKSNLDLLSLERGEITIDQAVGILMYTMEAYANGGLTLIKEAHEDNSRGFIQPTFFLNLLRKRQNIQ